MVVTKVLGAQISRVAQYSMKLVDERGFAGLEERKKNEYYK